MAQMTMASSIPTIRPLQYRDLDELKNWSLEDLEAGDDPAAAAQALERLDYIRRWYGPLKVISLFPNSYQHAVNTFVAEQQNTVLGLIQVSPFNQARSTWQIERIVVNRAALAKVMSPGFMDVGSRLLRHCFERVWEARTWMLEIDINYKTALALYRFNGFQPLAQVTYWSIAPEQLGQLAEREPNLPNLLPVSNADANLLYQLGTASVPPLVRQVFDQQIRDFKASPAQAISTTIDRLLKQSETVSAYVFEQQRKAAIGHFTLTISRDGSQPHQGDLTVHPAYTWLYPELMTQMAHILVPFPPQPLKLTSLDYQPEREEFLTQLDACAETHTLIMSRSVWHKVRESKPISLEGLQLSDVLSGLQPAGKPVPGRISWSADRWQSLWGSLDRTEGENTAPTWPSPSTANGGSRSGDARRLDQGEEDQRSESCS